MHHITYESLVITRMYKS